jgi:hypothetical protein
VKPLVLALALLANQARAAEFFDDFSVSDLAGLRAHGWVLRAGSGHPGAPGSRFDPAQIGLADGLLQLRLTTDGTPAGTLQPQLCHARKALVGTSSARVRFRDTAGSDPVVQSFFLAGPLRFDFDPDFSEVDFEYLPHGGWGSPETRLYGVSWQTVRLDPWQAHNHYAEAKGSHEGWHVLTVQVEAERTRHFVDGRLLRDAGGRSVPVVPMAISFSHWLAGGAQAGPMREHQFEVDWVLHVDGAPLSPAAMQQRVEALRAEGRNFVDTLPDRGLSSECNL